jgi:hypothetical protein
MLACLFVAGTLKPCFSQPDLQEKKRQRRLETHLVDPKHHIIGCAGGTQSENERGHSRRYFVVSNVFRAFKFPDDARFGHVAASQ